MKPLKEVLQVFKNRTIVVLLLAVFLSSCAHDFDHGTVRSYEGTIDQILKVKIKNKEDKQRLTVYASINRHKKYAVLDGVGKLDKHVFTLEVKNGVYLFKDYINDKQEKGNIKDFDLVPLDEETLFIKIDKNAPQPIIIEDGSKGLYVEITVVDQQISR